MSQDAGSPSEAAVALSSSPAAVDKLETKKSLLGLVEAIGESIVSFTPDFSLSDTWEETLSAFDSARAAATIVLADEPNIDKSQIRQVKSCLDKVLICLKAYQHSFHMMSAERIALGVFGAEISKLEASSKRPNLGRGCHGSNGGRDGPSLLTLDGVRFSIGKFLHRSERDVLETVSLEVCQHNRETYPVKILVSCDRCVDQVALKKTFGKLVQICGKCEFSIERQIFENCPSCEEKGWERARSFMSTPRNVWRGRHVTGRGRPIRKDGPVSRVPRLHVKRLHWSRGWRDFDLGHSLPPNLEYLSFGPKFNHALDRVSFPMKLRCILMGDEFNQNVDGVVWPVGLTELGFGANFNKPIDAIRWPPGLEVLSFRSKFNKPIDGVVWPQTLRVLNLGGEFNQDLAGVVWPPGLLMLDLGIRFNQPIDEVQWPRCLEHLQLGHLYNFPVEGVNFPSSLRQLFLGSRFNQVVARAKWPASLKELDFGLAFEQPLQGTPWPDGLERVLLSGSFNRVLTGVRWPAGLRELELGHWFDHPLDDVAWPVTLEAMTIGDTFGHPVGVDSWPAGLKRLSVGRNFVMGVPGSGFPPLLEELVFSTNFNQPIGAVHPVWPPTLRRMVFEWRFDQPIENIRWPPGLTELDFGALFNKPIEDAVWPPKLQRLRFCSGLMQAVEKVVWPKSLRFLALGHNCYHRNLGEGFTFPEWFEVEFVCFPSAQRIQELRKQVEEDEAAAAAQGGFAF